MREGSLEAPVRHPLDWNDPDFYNEEKLDEELRRVFDICHGCRRCFNLCDSFPRLFDLIDESETMELDSVDSKDFTPVIDACTLCDMCFMTKCPYVPPHEFNLDFPHLMLRARAIEDRKNEVGFVRKQLAQTDRNGKLFGAMAELVNWGSKTGNGLTRPLLQTIGGIHKDAALPKFNRQTLEKRAKVPLEINTDAPAHGRKVALYATCFANYNKPEIGEAALKVLARNGVETRFAYPTCCGMPKLEQGDLQAVADNARKAAAELGPLIDDGYDIVALVPSCALMLKFEWPLILPDDPAVRKLAEATYDVTEYIVDIAKQHGLAEGLKPLPGGVNMHLACHARAQNMGAKAVDMLKLIPDTDVRPIERCSGHGGSWGVMEEFFEVGMKVGKPVSKAALESGLPYVASECPLAADHILQGIERLDPSKTPPRSWHPVELFALAYGLVDGQQQ